MYRRIDGHSKLRPAQARTQPLSRQAYWRALMKLFADLTWRMR